MEFQHEAEMKNDFKKIASPTAACFFRHKQPKETAMSFQNPVFIPGPTNIPESLRKACDMPTIDHRSPLFGDILRPAREGVRKVLKSGNAEIFIFPSTGTGGCRARWTWT